MIKNPLKVGVVRICMDPESKDTWFGGMRADTFQGVATLITSKGPFKMEGARWQLLSQASSSEDMGIDFDRKTFFKKTWKVLRQAKLPVGVTIYIGDTTLTAPPLFRQCHQRGHDIVGCQGLGPASNQLDETRS